uniref:Uncharacterized protein n=1 Tax=Arundo donax TaxID=35708 RepID=A0A0A9EUC3_ARUDO
MRSRMEALLFLLGMGMERSVGIHSYALDDVQLS